MKGNVAGLPTVPQYSRTLRLENRCTPSSPDQSAGITGVENAYGMSAPRHQLAARSTSTTQIHSRLRLGCSRMWIRRPVIAMVIRCRASQAAGIYGGLTNGLSRRARSSGNTRVLTRRMSSTRRRLQFNNQNAIQQNWGLQGRRGHIGRFWRGSPSGSGGGRLGGQQQLAQAPVTPDLENQGYSQALQGG